MVATGKIDDFLFLVFFNLLFKVLSGSQVGIHYVVDFPVDICKVHLSQHSLLRKFPSFVCPDGGKSLTILICAVNLIFEVSLWVLSSDLTLKLQLCSYSGEICEKRGEERE